jgi:hypothetical protein
MQRAPSPCIRLFTAVANDGWTSIWLKNPLLVRRRCSWFATVSEVKLGFFASCGEDRGREGAELRQFSEILGGGGQ